MSDDLVLRCGAIPSTAGDDATHAYLADPSERSVADSAYLARVQRAAYDAVQAGQEEIAPLETRSW
jgi:hypothetical protein